MKLCCVIRITWLFSLPSRSDKAMQSSLVQAEVNCLTNICKKRRVLLAPFLIGRVCIDLTSRKKEFLFDKYPKKHRSHHPQYCVNCRLNTKVVVVMTVGG